MRPDFAACGSEFLNNSAGAFSKYVYNGTKDAGSSAGLALTTTHIFTWKDASTTITTWVLPIIGLLVQAPYESNQAWQTILALCRWSGSPIAALSYILWNIKVTGKCALMIDMATRYDEYPNEGTDFSNMRDSLYILCIMNQYTPSPSLPPVEAERLIRITLFSNLLPLNGSGDAKALLRRRTELAQNFREGRKKGVIPVFISFLWFIFALVLSIQLAFDDLGGNETAHNLALGLVVGWLPILILASTVDRNLVSADAIREKLNHLVDDVRLALLDPETVGAYMQMVRSTEEDFVWTKCLDDPELFGGGFFQAFGGQGRTHWHYGVAHPILSGIETKFMASYGRDWLRHPSAARHAMIVESRNINGLRMFDPRMLWQITSSLFLVCGCAGGAFILSWFTPTVGLGCRSGGYFVYLVVALGLLSIEILTWWLTHETTHTASDPLTRVGTRLKEYLSHNGDEEKMTILRHKIRSFLVWFTSNTFRDAVRNFIIRPLEIGNTIWLTYIIIAQTFGSYQTCDCMASDWVRGGGYIDFLTAAEYTARGVNVYWGAATALSCFVMSGGLAYTVFEYCSQSHFSTEDYGRAMQGLRMTRWFKKHTRVFRLAPDLVIKAGKLLWYRVSGGRSRRGRRSLVWTADTNLYSLSNLRHAGYG